MAESKLATTDSRRIVSKKWTLGETLGKGAYGFVKCGYHVKNGKPFALKFMRKAGKHEAWAQDQAQMVATEINALQKISHPNVLKLFAYNLKCAYPQKDGTSFDTVLLVLELAPGGELFDILYYTSKLKPEIAQTYFYQLAQGLHAIHQAGICHRDLKPQNLLLNKRYELKITDFGLAKIFSNDQKIMSTQCVGTKGYQAPELLLKRKYTQKCDVFSCGVILFILLTGYPPFEEATAKDTWYRKICQEKFELFWTKHDNCGVEQIDPPEREEVKKLIQDCICYQPAKRFTVEQMMESSWLKTPKLDKKQLEEEMTSLHSEAMKKKRSDARKMDSLATSMVNRDSSVEEEIPVVPALCSHLNNNKVYLMSEMGSLRAEYFMKCVQESVTTMKGTTKTVDDSKWHTLSKITTTKGSAYLEVRVFTAMSGEDAEKNPKLVLLNVHGDTSPGRSAGVNLLDGVMTDAGWAIGDSKIFDIPDIEYTKEDEEMCAM